ncbi:alpha-2-macroglobulin family protein [Luteimonas sp. SJ-92]|uniref:Alpha-2-macroglobulin family protein n=1 Tax=Luteimonas salinisoli TaxID=2752307 RepID=A0A853J7P2_9GAMM|nr:alpha-2-macroglobulin [Luteimonas salinisoli]NZA24758.1 alpha-2-macroglobulin family protein [Luteimonas salinisoli]
MTTREPASTPSRYRHDSWPERLAQALFGRFDWQPPGWLRAWGGQVRNRPMHWLGGAFALIAVLLWWHDRPEPPPRPDAIAATVIEPKATDYAKSPPRISPLRLRFAKPVAPLERIGEEPQGVALKPAHPGTWLWSDDRTLVFTPAEDWPVATDFEIRIDPAQALAPGRPLTDTGFGFSTAPFEAKTSGADFHQDPEDPNLKKAVYALRFSHPVDAASLERALAFDHRDGAGRALPAPEWTVVYDDSRLEAWVHSAPLRIPENGGALKLEVDAGVASALGGKGTPEALWSEVALPSLYSVEVGAIDAALAENDRYEPEQVLVVGFNQAMRDADVSQAVEAWLLPERHPQRPASRQSGPWRWSPSEVDEAVLKASQALALAPLPAEREYVETHSFRYQAPPGRYLYVRVDKGLKSFGGFLLGQPASAVQRVPDYPELLRFVGEGALLSLRGERRVSVAARNVPGLRLEVARVLPGALHQLVQHNRGDYGEPHFYSLSEDSLVEREEIRRRLPAGDPARTRYEGIDLGPHLAPGRRGVFLLSLRTLSESDAEKPAEQTLADNAGSERDSRLVVLTDLGMLVKRALDGSRDVFVQSISAGTPVAGARVRAIARNGETLVEALTDADGRARLPALDEFKREKQPLMLTVAQGDDLSFLPIDDRRRRLDYSRFDVGGDENQREAGALKASLFSDRGLYRPGDTVHLGLIVRAADWSRPLQGLPLEMVITDPRGTVARRERLTLGEIGFEGFDFTPPRHAPSGAWEANLYLLGKDDERTGIGATTVQVREFLPDSMRVGVRFNRQAGDGWVRPEGLVARVGAENLFGTPAAKRRVEADMVLRPALPAFAGWPGWTFHDPQRAEEGYEESLSETVTDADGEAEIALDLERYARASYQLDLLVRAFEPGSGRNVAARATTLVSDNAFLVGMKSADPLHHVARGSKRSVRLVAIGPDAKARAVDGLRAVLVERSHVSVLTRQRSGLYRYVSQQRLDDRSDQPLALRAGESEHVLATDRPGDFLLEIRDGDGSVLNRIAYSVAGAANLARSLERNAELSLSLSRQEYAPGDVIEIGVRAPYPGAGLITIERDRVYAHAWFKADTTSSVQRIRLPEGFEGNGYVNVQFLRDPMSDEVFMSPLSYGVAPFRVDRGARTQPLSVSLPEVSRPGAEIPLTIRTEGRARVVAFAVDEGILQVARYRVGDPLDDFFARKRLQVDTAQILDLILPEFSRLATIAAPGGDGDAGLARHLNPFGRKSEKPAVWWSGMVEVDGERTLEFRLPDHFNGRARVVAVAVTPQRIGLAETTMVSRGDFVLTPTVPTHVAPGDEFELPVGVANMVTGGDGELPVTVRLSLPPELEAVGDPAATVSLGSGREDSVRLRVRAGERLGAVPVTVIAESGRYRAQRTIEVSVRPATVARQDVRLGHAQRREELTDLRRMYGQRAQRRIAASTSPFVAVDGLAAFLRDYPHLCTEQVVSAAVPGLVDATHPEFGLLPGNGDDAVAGAIAALRARQNGEGGFGTWRATPDADPFVSAYTALYLVEARERGRPVPPGMLDAANRYLAGMAADRALRSQAQLRARALAVYLLVRQGRSAGNLLGAVREQLQRDFPDRWHGDDATVMLLASSYRLLQQDEPARALAGPVFQRMNAAAPVPWSGFADYHDPGIARGWAMLLLHRHFPDMARRLGPAAIEGLLAPLRENRHNTLSSALTLLALEAYGAAQAQAAPPAIEAVDAGGRARPIGEVAGLLRQATFAADDRALRVLPGDGATAWYALSQSGFDLQPGPAVQDRGLEVVRDYLDDEGRPVAEVPLGAEVTVRLRVRALDAERRGDIAIVDLLPGGFETVMQLPARASDDADASEPPAASLALPGSSFVPEHIEPREDRVLLYGTAHGEAREFRYRIRAGNVGRFAVPPIHAESMYERVIYAQGAAGAALNVTAPER